MCKHILTVNAFFWRSQLRTIDTHECANKRVINTLRELEENGNVNEQYTAFVNSVLVVRTVNTSTDQT